MWMTWSEAHGDRWLLLRGHQGFRPSYDCEVYESSRGYDVAYDEGPDGFGVCIGDHRGRVLRLGEADSLVLAMAACYDWFACGGATYGSEREHFQESLRDCIARLNVDGAPWSRRVTLGHVDSRHCGFEFFCDRRRYHVRRRGARDHEGSIASSSDFRALVEAMSNVTDVYSFEKHEAETKRLAEVVEGYERENRHGPPKYPGNLGPW